MCSRSKLDASLQPQLLLLPTGTLKFLSLLFQRTMNFCNPVKGKLLLLEMVGFRFEFGQCADLAGD
jgi:hypothetical protein